MMDVTELSSFKENRLERVRRMGAAVKHVELAIEKIEDYSDIEGFDDAISMLTSLRKTLSDNFEYSVHRLEG